LTRELCGLVQAELCGLVQTEPCRYVLGHMSYAFRRQ
jgi:hypothetical protein